ncbi:MAG: VTT domain-containing protein [Candidatus Thorarchaeota archaeon]
MQDLFVFITEMITQGYLGLFIICFAINMIPFLSPSNMVIAGAAALLVPELGWIQIGLIVAITATLAKFVHYAVVRGSRMILSEERIKMLETEKTRVQKWGALALFIAAASPVPDDPLIVYVGLAKYNSAKFIISYFIGKVAVTLVGAFIGFETANYFESTPIVLASIALTAIITGILFKRRTEGKESEMLQEILEEELVGDDYYDHIADAPEEDKTSDETIGG